MSPNLEGRVLCSISSAGLYRSDEIAVASELPTAVARRAIRRLRAAGLLESARQDAKDRRRRLYRKAQLDLPAIDD